MASGKRAANGDRSLLGSNVGWVVNNIQIGDGMEGVSEVGVNGSEGE